MSFYIKKKNILVSWNEWFSNWIYWILDHFSPSLRNFLNVRIFTLETGPRGNIKFWKTFVANSSSLDISAIVQRNKHTQESSRLLLFSNFFKSIFELWRVWFLSVTVNIKRLSYLSPSNGNSIVWRADSWRRRNATPQLSALPNDGVAVRWR